MLTIVSGRSGSGKTPELLHRIKQDAENAVPSVFIVPEQSVFITEEKLAQVLPMSAQQTFSVMSFSKFATWIFERCGKLSTVPMSYTAQVSIMWKTLASLSDSLTVYGKMRKNAGLIQPLLNAMEDFSRFGVTPESLKDAADRLTEKPPLSRKLSDLSFIYAAYSGLLDAYNKGNNHDELRRATELLRTSDKKLLSAYHFYFDSFAYFTAAELSMLREIAARAESVTVALCLDPDDRDNVIFADAVRTEMKLLQTATDLSQKADIITLSAPVINNPYLRAIESNLWSHGTPCPYAADDDTLRITECPNPFAEAETAALHVRELVLSGMRYRDIAVIVRDTGSWNGIIDAAFEKNNIPYFLSDSLPLSVKMPVQMLLSVLRAIDSKWSTDDMIALAKTGLFPATAEEISLFAEYVETWKIHGGLFVTGNWTMNPDGFVPQTSPRARLTLDAANKVRDILMPPLLTLQLELHRATDGAAMCRALGRYLRTVSLGKALQTSAAKEWDEGHPRDAFDTLRTGDAILSVLNDTAAQLRGTEKPTLTEFCTLLTVIFSGSTIGSVPQTSDCVMIGAADVLRTEKVKATLVLGLNEGEFPKNSTAGGTFTEQDKKDLEHVDFNPDYCQSGRMNAADEFFYLYRAVTRPTEKLWLSYHSYNADMEKCFPSIAVPSLLSLFPGLTVTRFSPASIVLGNAPAGKADGECGVTAAIPLPENTLYLSQSKLDRYAQCPYSYYAAYVLELQEKVTGDFGPADMGTFIHYILEKLVPTFVNPQTGKKELPDTETLTRKVDEIADVYINDLHIPLPFMTKNLEHTIQRMKDVAHTMAAGICRDLAESSFCPAAFEMEVGEEQNGIPLVFPVGDKYRIVYRGKIDRIDTAEGDGITYAAVVDYKTGDKKFRADKISKGLLLQLPLYLNGILDSRYRNAQPTAAYYLTVSDNKEGRLTAKKSGFFQESPVVPESWSGKTAPLGKSAKMSRDAFHSLLQDTKDTFFDIADRIYRGEFPKTPSADACLHCPIAGNCIKSVKTKP